MTGVSAVSIGDTAVAIPKTDVVVVSKKAKETHQFYLAITH